MIERTNKPTSNQLDLLYKWYQWRLPVDLARDAVKWLGEHSTKKAVSAEIARVHDLYYGFKLTKETCFDSPIWNNYKIKKEEA